MNSWLVAALCAVFAVAVSPVLTTLIEAVPEGRSLRPWRSEPRRLVDSVGAAVVLALLGLKLGWHSDLIAFVYVGLVGWALAVIDQRHKRLPDALTLTSYPVVIALLAIAAAFEHRFDHFVRALLGMAIFWLFYFVLWLIHPAGMGRGDLKLSGVLGLILGWIGWGAWGVGLLSGFFLGGVLGAMLMMARKADRKSKIPFGPFMLMGAMVGILWGATIASAYVHASLG